MSSPANSTDATNGESFPDLKTHQQMWSGFTHLLVRSIIGVVIVVLFIGFVTGTL
jgi:hypothetical protein